MSDDRTYIGTQKVRHIATHDGHGWMSICRANAVWTYENQNTLVWGSYRPDEHSVAWRRPVCKRCIQEALVIAAAALDVPSGPGVTIREKP